MWDFSLLQYSLSCNMLEKKRKKAVKCDIPESKALQIIYQIFLELISRYANNTTLQKKTLFSW